MKILVAIMTCHRLDYFINDLTVEYNKNRCLDQAARVHTIRETWAKDLSALGIDYKFFYGTILRDETKPNQRPSTIVRTQLRPAEPDEEYLLCGDNYTANPMKVKAICRWALDRGYDYVLRTDDDTFVYPDRLLVQLQSKWAGQDYAGSSNKDFHPGGCLFLSRKMMELIIAAPVTTYADDVWMGRVADAHRVPMTYIPEIHNLWGDDYDVVPKKLPIHRLAALHSCKPEAMRELYAAA